MWHELRLQISDEVRVCEKAPLSFLEEAVRPAAERLELTPWYGVGAVIPVVLNVQRTVKNGRDVGFFHGLVQVG